MGMFWVMFMGKPENKLLKMKARSEKRIAKEQEKVCAINLELSKRKAEK